MTNSEKHSNSVQSCNVQHFHIKDDVIWRIWKCQGWGWHICLSVIQAFCSSDWRLPVGTHVWKKKRKKHVRAKPFHADWLGSIEGDDNERIFCIKVNLWGKCGKHLDSSPLRGPLSIPIMSFSLISLIIKLVFLFCFCRYLSTVLSVPLCPL